MSNNTRIHPDALIPVGDCTLVTTNGAVTLTVPDEASGVLMQNLATNGSYWNTSATMTGVDQGFKFDASPLLMWFTSQTPYVYLYLHDDDTIVYQFVAPVAY
jgi:hypothetical protein